MDKFIFILITVISFSCLIFLITIFLNLSKIKNIVVNKFISYKYEDTIIENI